MTHGATTIQASQVGLLGDSNSSPSVFVAVNVNVFEGVSTTAWAIVANTGTGTIQLDVGCDVGNVWSTGNVDMPSGSTVVVHGSLRTTGTADENAGQVTGTVFENATITLGTTTIVASFPVVSGSTYSISSGSDTINPGAINDIFVDGGTLTISEGSYGHLTVNGGTVILNPGTYTFTNVTWNPNGTFSPSNSGGVVRVNVQNTLLFRGACSTSFTTANMRWAVFGSGGATLGPTTSSTNVFRGTVVAMNGPLIVEDGTRTYRGAFFGQSVNVHTNATIQHIAYADWEPPT